METQENSVNMEEISKQIDEIFDSNAKEYSKRMNKIVRSVGANFSQHSLALQSDLSQLQSEEFEVYVEWSKQQAESKVRSIAHTGSTGVKILAAATAYSLGGSNSDLDDDIDDIFDDNEDAFEQENEAAREKTKALVGQFPQLKDKIVAIAKGVAQFLLKFFTKVGKTILDLLNKILEDVWSALLIIISIFDDLVDLLVQEVEDLLELMKDILGISLTIRLTAHRNREALLTK